jgi:hypothetical protein
VTLGEEVIGAGEIAWKTFKQFWSWICAATTTLAATVGSTWGRKITTGDAAGSFVVCGLVERSRAEQILQCQPEGTFLLRTSCSQPRQLVISVVVNGSVEHEVVDARFFESKRNIDDVILTDYLKLTAVMTTSGHRVEKSLAFTSPSRAPNKHLFANYRRAG